MISDGSLFKNSFCYTSRNYRPKQKHDGQSRKIFTESSHLSGIIVIVMLSQNKKFQIRLDQDDTLQLNNK